MTEEKSKPTEAPPSQVDPVVFKKVTIAPMKKSAMQMVNRPPKEKK